MYMQSRVIKKSVLSICQSYSLLVDLFGQNIKACMLTGLKITSGIILISQPNRGDDQANTDPGHLFIVEQYMDSFINIVMEMNCCKGSVTIISDPTISLVLTTQRTHWGWTLCPL